MKPELLLSVVTVNDIFPDFVQILHILRIWAGDWMLDTHSYYFWCTYHLQDKQ